ncbi:hypothetical protein KO507_16445 [Gilvimarinus agarilyticus]|uniref:hypothetical protein n=1 Tax=Gilvimarinus sp. 2_MG-2023 TaxID=3062666 RepID=UPI001C0A1643|nr:hypothetical protein [Gilvimarinus sp. 2_MG-2023]MBU2887357.1 hypothetical protein [Gilvimarinus agarilyticus]MDO6572015.1 hypothetical protein [Gilvimarinus sp. 2_MG-2023]
MTTTAVHGVDIEGTFSAFIATNVSDVRESTATKSELILASVEGESISSSGTKYVTVTSGTPSLTLGIGNWQEGSVDGAWIRLYRPDGTVVEVSTDLNNPNQLVWPAKSSGTSQIQSAVIINPEPGDWRIDYTVSDTSPALQVMAGATPLTGGMNTMAADTGAALESVFQPSHKRSISSWECAGCKIATYGLAVAITAVIAGTDAAFLSADCALVVATAGLAGVTAPAALAFIVGLDTAGVMVVDYVLSQLCIWVGACDS